MLQRLGLGVMAGFYTGMFVLALVVARVAGFNPFTRAPLGLSEALALCAAGLLAGVAGAAASALASRWSVAARRMDEGLAELVGPVPTSEALIMAAYSGLAEELLFRGALQPLVGPWVACALFALAHLPPKREMWPWTVMAGIFGAGLAALTEATGSVVAAVVAHATVNAIGLVRLGRMAKA